MRFSDDTMEWFQEAYAAAMEATLRAFAERRPGEVQPWSVMLFSQVHRVHTEFVDLGFIRSEKILEQLIEQTTRNVLRIQINTELMGHEALSVKDIAEEYGYTESELEDYPDWAVDEKGTWRISDYAMRGMIGLVLEMRQEPLPEQQLVLLNRLLNLVHQRSDLAGWFVEGGSAALSQLSAAPEKTLEPLRDESPAPPG